MASPRAFAAQTSHECNLTLAATYPRLRVLAWDDATLYASHGYHLLRLNTATADPQWQALAKYRPSWRRKLSSSSRLASRLFRDGFHALTKLQSGGWLAAVPGAIIRLNAGESDFEVSHRITRGTRPLHIAVTPDNRAYWGEYFDNSSRNEVHIYTSSDNGYRWEIAYTFPKGAIRHVHNIVHDRWQKCLWIFTGDEANECRILCASSDLKNVEVVVSGSQQSRAAACIPAEDGLYFSSDTPLQQNFIYHLDRAGNLHRLAGINGSSIYGCRVGQAIFFSTMVEPSAVNRERVVGIYGSPDQINWKRHLEWKKDRWPMHFFQYGNAMLPDGNNSTRLLAVSTVAVQQNDCETSIWRVSSTA